MVVGGGCACETMRMVSEGAIFTGFAVKSEGIMAVSVWKEGLVFLLSIIKVTD